MTGKGEKIAIVIPARYASSRFPGKPLVEINGKSLIEQVYNVASRSKAADIVCIATDDNRIADAVRRFSGNVVMTSSNLRTGSDRVAEVAEKIDADFYINLQADELLSSPELLDFLVEKFTDLSDEYSIGTIKRKINDVDEVRNINVVKVVSDCNDTALYFSRSAIPCIRDGSLEEKFESADYYKHFGIYIYRKNALLEFSRKKTGKLEDLEKLEQLRAMEAGMKIKVFETGFESIRIDTPEDLVNAKLFFA